MLNFQKWKVMFYVYRDSGAIKLDLFIILFKKQMS